MVSWDSPPNADWFECRKNNDTIFRVEYDEEVILEVGDTIEMRSLGYDHLTSDWSDIHQRSTRLIEVTFTNYHSLPWVFHWWHDTIRGETHSHTEFGDSTDVVFQIPESSYVAIYFDKDSLMGNTHAGTEAADINPYGLNNVDGCRVYDNISFGDVSDYMNTIIRLRTGYWYSSSARWSTHSYAYKVKLAFVHDNSTTSEESLYEVDISSGNDVGVSVNIPYHCAMTIKAFYDGQRWREDWQAPNQYTESRGVAVCDESEASNSSFNSMATLHGSDLYNLPVHTFTVFEWSSGI